MRVASAIRYGSRRPPVLARRSGRLLRQVVDVLALLKAVKEEVRAAEVAGVVWVLRALRGLLAAVGEVVLVLLPAQQQQQQAWVCPREIDGTW